MADTGHLLFGRSKGDVMLAIYQLEEGGQITNNTQQLISSLVFAESKAIRTSTVILAAFNMAAALATACRIIYDCYWASKRRNCGPKAKKFCISAIHPTETFPLVLALGIVIQGFVFSAAQSTGLSSLFTNGCSTIAQFVFPAIFLVPYIQIVFGLECAIRSLRKGGFPARGKYDVTICLGVIVLMIIGTWIPTHLRVEKDNCFASLAWFVTKYGRLGLVLLAITTGLAIISAITIFYRLTTVTAIDQQQRIAASRLVYYLVLAVVSLAFVIPWFVTLTMSVPSLITSMMATVVLNLHGLLAGLLQLFLRSNTTTTSFKPKGTPGWGRGRDEISLWGPNELGFDGHILQPVCGPRSPGTPNSKVSLVKNEKGRPLSLDSMRSPPLYRSPKQADHELCGKLPTISEPVVAQSRGHARKQSYSLFPLDAAVSSPQQKQVPSAAEASLKAPGYEVRDTMAGLFDSSSNSRQAINSACTESNLLAPPPPLHFIGNTGRHRRDSSMESSATVQIGLRLSHVVNDPEDSIRARNRPLSPVLQPQTPKLNITRPSPLQRNAIEPPIPAAGRDARMKTLPPVPRDSTISRESAARESPTHLTPRIYSPQSSKKSTTSPPPRPAMNSPIRMQKTQDQASGQRPRTSKTDWI